MKPKTKTIIFIALSFILGIVCGIFIDGKIAQKPYLFKEKGPRDFHKMLIERLKLDERQITQMDSLLESRKKMMDTHRKYLLAMRDTMQLEIKKILNEEQTKLFDEINREISKKKAKRLEKELEKR